MTTKQKVWLSAVIAVGLGLVILGSYLYPQNETVYVDGNSVGSPAGSTFSSAKIATVSMVPATGSATSSSILNTDSSDRWVEDFVVSCSGIGTSQGFITGGGLATNGWGVNFGTTSVASQGNQGNANTTFVNLATSSPHAYNVEGVSTTTVTGLKRLWASGSYMTYTFNATNTASCIVGVNYLAS